ADVANTAVWRLLGGGSRGGSPWSLLVGLYTFEPADVTTLSHVAALGRAVGAPWLAAAHPRFMGADSFGSDPDEWTPASFSAWDDLRSSASASFLSLSLPRFLLRVPYGRHGEECEEMRFEEMGAAAPEHTAFLWGNPALLAALAIAEHVAEGGGPATHATIERLPLYVAPVDGEPTATPCAEALLSQRLVEEMLELGLTAIASPRDADEIRVPRIQSVAAPARPLSVRVTAP
ncbi:MAG: type VI secretion system contractile sheath domain-containing protein, partial [Gemmatimonadaceae bacterium]